MRQRRAPRPRSVSICVLPFQNMSGDAEQEYFSDGISEDITTDLSKVSALEVIARNTAFTFKGQSVDVCEVAKKLDVSHVLEGSVRKAGDRVRITAQLIDGATGGHVWAERYDRDSTDIFAIQDEISKAIVHALKLKLLPEEKKAIEQRGTNNAEAYNLYLLARQYWITGNHGDSRREERVMRICSRAVEIDPYYAQAWALLAIAQSSLQYGFGRDVDDGFAAAHAALAIDPTIAEAHLPMVKRLQEKRQVRRRRPNEIEAAIRLGPEFLGSEQGGGPPLPATSATSPTRDPSLRKSRRADGNGFPRLGDALDLLQAVGEQAKLRERREDDGLGSAAARSSRIPSNGAALGILAGGYALLGEGARPASGSTAHCWSTPTISTCDTISPACSRRMGDKEEALKMLKSTLPRVGEYQVRVAETDTDLDSLRDDPRFVSMLDEARKRLGIEQVKGDAATELSR